MPLTGRALDALDAVPPRLDTALVFPAARAVTSVSTRGAPASGYPALEAAGIPKRGPYHLRHTFATEALAAGVSIFELSRLMGSSVAMIDRTYGHLACDSRGGDARAARRKRR